MNYIKKIINEDYWFGDENSQINFNNEAYSLEEKKFLQLLNELKKGNFKSKDDLIYIFKNTDNIIMKKLSLELFFSVATNKDIKKFKKDFYEMLEDEEVAIILSCAYRSLSYEIFGLLTDLREYYEDTQVELEICQEIEDLLYGFEAEELFENPSKEEEKQKIKSAYLGKNIQDYFWNNKKISINNIKNQIIEEIKEAIESEEFYRDYSNAGIILSLYTGIKIPKIETRIPKLEDLKEILKILNQISEKNYTEGKKYFYGKEVF